MRRLRRPDIHQTPAPSEFARKFYSIGCPVTCFYQPGDQLFLVQDLTTIDTATARVQRLGAGHWLQQRMHIGKQNSRPFAHPRQRSQHSQAGRGGWVHPFFLTREAGKGRKYQSWATSETFQLQPPWIEIPLL